MPFVRRPNLVKMTGSKSDVGLSKGITSTVTLIREQEVDPEPLA